MSQSEYIVDPKRWYDILLDDKLDLSNCIFLNENMVQVTYKHKDVYVVDSTSTNIFIATFTTSNARLRLYDMLDRLGEDIVYYDTDSVVYIDSGNNKVPTGSMLGDWSSELAEGDYITDWLSTGPKSYYFKTFKGVEVTKIKGFTMNYENSREPNNFSLKTIIDDTSSQIKLVYDQIARDTSTKEIITRKRASKTFKKDYKKRRLINKYDENVLDTVPWGY